METLVLSFLYGIIIVLVYIWGKNNGIKYARQNTLSNGQWLDTEITGGYMSPPTSSLNEVPAEFLMGGDIDRALHIAGVKEATPAKIAEWEDNRRAKVEAKTELSVDELIGKLNKNDLQIKAGLIENTDKTGTDIKIQVKEINAANEISFRIQAAKKEHEREREQRVKIDFDSLNFSRISNEARKKITQIVKTDLENKIKVIEENTPEINEDNQI